MNRRPRRGSEEVILSNFQIKKLGLITFAISDKEPLRWPDCPVVSGRVPCNIRSLVKQLAVHSKRQHTTHCFYSLRVVSDLITLCKDSNKALGVNFVKREVENEVIIKVVGSIGNTAVSN